MAKWKCKICGYIYDDKQGEPQRNIEPGTPFESLPDSYKCPVCGAAKKMFIKIED